jgi:cysteine desulfurase
MRYLLGVTANAEVYLDNNATCPLRPRVRERMKEAIDRYHANASSAHSAGQNSRQAIESTRREMAKALACEPSEIIFTSSASESNMMTLWGLWIARTNEDKARKKIITSPLEHSSVYENLQFLGSQFGAEIVMAPLDATGTVDSAAFKKLLGPDVAFVTMIGAHNELGIIQPWQALAEMAHAQQIPFHVDLVQCLLRMPLNLKNSKASAVTLCFHKAGGPKGAGVLYLREGTAFEPMLRGGGQERKRRSGTENIVAIVGAGALLEEAGTLIEAYQAKVKNLRDQFEAGLKKIFPEVSILGDQATRLTNTTYALFPGFRSDVLMMKLDLNQICVSTGSACSSGMVVPSRAVMSLGYTEEQALTGLRFSWSPENSEADLAKVLECLSTALTKKSWAP